MTLNEYLKTMPIIIQHTNGYAELIKMSENGLIRTNGQCSAYGDTDISKFKLGTTEFVNGACLLMLEYSDE